MPMYKYLPNTSRLRLLLLLYIKYIYYVYIIEYRYNIVEYIIMYTVATVTYKLFTWYNYRNKFRVILTHTRCVCIIYIIYYIIVISIDWYILKRIIKGNKNLQIIQHTNLLSNNIHGCCACKTLFYYDLALAISVCSLKV